MGDKAPYPTVPGFDYATAQAHYDAAYGHMADADPEHHKGREIHIAVLHGCPHCQQSQINNQYATETSGHTPVFWEDAGNPYVDEMMAKIPGITVDKAPRRFEENGKPMYDWGSYSFNGTPLKLFPMVYETVDGKVTRLLWQPIQSVEIPAGELDRITARLQATDPSYQPVPAPIGDTPQPPAATPAAPQQQQVSTLNL